ncbi:GNAT family N-acetyltransferase [Streptomyces sp. NPDC057555]|uniref:BioF2-like acetyltransferase domain-containing protein n=1 Tax=Streptomyces sp. JCM 9888 TaxID=1570103 RepID=A0A0B5GUH0_9ACTN|nr:hypothetical protein [Streptomyces sp. JCM 9888]
MVSDLRAYSRVNSIPRDEWDHSTVDSSLWATTDWLRNVEGGFSDERSYVVSAGGAMAVYHVNPDSYPDFVPRNLLSRDAAVNGLASQRAPHEQQRLVELLRGLGQDALAHAAVCAVPWGFTRALWARDADTREALLTELEGTATRWDSGTSAVLYVDQDEQALRQALVKRGYVEVLAAGNSVLDVPEGGFDGYVETLRSKDRRTVRREIRNLQPTGITFRTADIADVVKDVAGLSAALDAKHGLPYNPELHSKILLSQGEDLNRYHRVVVAERPNGTIAGFLVCFIKDGVLYPKMSGYDPQNEGEEYTYFNLGYYEMVRQAQAAELHTIEYGTEAYQAKVIRGCRIRRLYSYIKPPAELRDTVRELGALVTRAQEQSFDAMLAGRTAADAERDGV